ncbi:MAG: DHHA1 domain-containing protein, partial [Myxococcota bacterium]
KILSESGIAAGVRRIEAQTALGALATIRDEERVLRRVASLLKTSPGDVPDRVEKLLEERRSTERKLEEALSAKRGAASRDLSAAAVEIAGVRVVAARVDASGKELRNMVDDLRAKLGSGVVLLAAEQGGRLSLALGVTVDLRERFPAGKLIGEVARIVGGKGGGRPDFAQGGAGDASKLDAAFGRLEEMIAEA